MYCIEELGLYLCFLKTYILLKNEDCSSGHGEDNWSFSALNLGEKIMTMLFETITLMLRTMRTMSMTMTMAMTIMVRITIIMAMTCR